MKQKIGLFALIALLGFPAFGQRSAQLQVPGVGLNTASLEDNGYFKPKKKKKKKKKTDKEEANTEWKENVWYGANGVLGGGSSNNRSQFAVGIQPLVGYKVFPFWSVGPRLGLIYQLDKIPYSSTITLSYNTWQMTGGLFTRFRFWNLFVHAEASHDWIRQTAKEPVSGEKQTVKDQRNNQFIGLGWNEGRAKTMGYEILLLVNIKNATDPSYPYVPIEFRGGLTYNF